MDKKNIRFILIFSICFLGFWLFDAWQQKNQPVPTASDTAKAGVIELGTAHDDIPVVPTNVQANQATESLHTSDSAIDEARLVKVKTDVFNLSIDTLGGDIVYTDLPAYPKSLKEKSGIELLSSKPNSFYMAQSGLLSEQGPERRVQGKSVRGQYKAEDMVYDFRGEQSPQSVSLNYTSDSGVKITKNFEFSPNSYVIKISYIINNQSASSFQGRLYGRIKRKAKEQDSGFMGMRTFSGIALNTEEKPYRKFTYKDLAKKNFEESKKSGWVAVVDHYFLTAMVPEKTKEHFYRTEMFGNDTYGAVFVEPEVSIAPGEQQTVAYQLYIGPENSEVLGGLAKGLELTNDYGIFWPICEPVFWILKQINQWVNNWGLAIILTTIFIKLLFFKLSASSYRSMANMRKLQPKLTQLKERYGEDKQRFSQEMMALYRQEKVNPLGGCLPILVQIPVFLALYYVLLSTVELRQAPFMLWIQDLSAKDPFYVLPILMGATMLIQQKLSPPPPDPMQAKVMMAMPIVFTVIFLNFPAGLVLYWFVNNLLSITQQWYITRTIENHTQQKRWAKKT